MQRIARRTQAVKERFARGTALHRFCVPALETVEVLLDSGVRETATRIGRRLLGPAATRALAECFQELPELVIPPMVGAGSFEYQDGL
jgi:hypothetical protein